MRKRSLLVLGEVGEEGVVGAGVGDGPRTGPGPIPKKGGG